MAEEVQIRNSNEMAKVRNPLAPALLPFVTFGIYSFVWYFKINKEMAALGRARGTSELGDNPAMSLLAVLVGWIILVPPFVSLYNTSKRVEAAQRLAGRQDPTSAGLLFVLTIFISPVAFYMMQDGLNKVWASEGQGGQGAIPGGAGFQQQAHPAPGQVPPPPPPPQA